MTLHSHTDIIDLSPLVEERHPIKPPQNASAEEFHCQWYQITEKINYPMGLASGKVTFNVCFHNLSNGVQSHVFAPLGLDIRQKYTVGGSLPGEPIEAVELGLGAPKTGLYLREDVDMRCNMLMTSFVKKNLKKASTVLVDRMVEKAHITETQVRNEILLQQQHTGSTTTSGNTSPYIGAPPSPRFPPPQTYQQQSQTPFMPPSPAYQPNPDYPQSGVSNFDEKRRQEYQRLSVVMSNPPMSPPITPRYPSGQQMHNPNSNNPALTSQLSPTHTQFAPNPNAPYIPNPHYNPAAVYEAPAGRQDGGFYNPNAGHMYHPTELPTWNQATQGGGQGDPAKNPYMFGNGNGGYHHELE